MALAYSFFSQRLVRLKAEKLQIREEPSWTPHAWFQRLKTKHGHDASC